MLLYNFSLHRYWFRKFSFAFCFLSFETFLTYHTTTFLYWDKQYPTSGYSYQDETTNREQFTTFGNYTWRQENWGHYYNPPQIDYEVQISSIVTYQYSVWH